MTTITKPKKGSLVVGSKKADKINIKKAYKNLNINSKNGNDTIVVNNSNKKVTINAGNGKNKIDMVNTIGKATVVSGSGNDTINVYALSKKKKVTAKNGNYDIKAGNGNNVINVNSNGNFNITTGKNNDKVTITGNGIHKINLGNGTNTLSLKGSGTNVINSGSGNDIIKLINTSGSTELNAGAGNNKIYVQGTGNNTIYTAQNNDVFYLQGGSKDNTTTINAGAGVNTFNVYSKNEIGNITINEQRVAASNVVNFVDGLKGISAKRTGYNLVFYWSNSNLILQNYFKEDLANASYSFQVAGTIMSLDSIIETVGELAYENVTIDVIRDDSDDVIYSSEFDDIITAGSGNNVIHYLGSFGNDTINLSESENLLFDLSALNLESKDIAYSIKNEDVIISTSYGSINLAGFAKSDLVGEQGSVKLKISDNPMDLIDLKTQKYNVVLNDNYKGSWLGENISVPFDNLNVASDFKGLNNTKNIKINSAKGDDIIDISSQKENNIEIFFNEGDGNLTIKGYHFNLENSDENVNLIFKTDNETDPFLNVKRIKSGNDFIIKRENGETLTIENYFNDDGSYDFSSDIIQDVLDIYPDKEGKIKAAIQNENIKQFNYYSFNGKNVMEFSKIPNVEYNVYSASDGTMDEIQIPVYSPSGSDIRFQKENDDLIIQYKCDKTLDWSKDNITTIRLIAYCSNSHTTLDCVTYQNSLYNGLLSKEPAVNTISYGMADSDKTLYGSWTDETFNQISNLDTITIKAGSGNDIISTYAVKSYLYGDEGNDIITGTTQGEDTFCFKKGDGSDVIYGGTKTGADDTILFKDLENSDDIEAALEGNNLIIKYTNKDTITITDYLDNNEINSSIKYVEFENLGIRKVFDKTCYIKTVSNNDFENIKGSILKDKIYIKNDNVTVNSIEGDDEIYIGQNHKAILEFSDNGGFDTVYFAQSDVPCYIKFSDLNRIDERISIKISNNDLVINYANSADDINVQGYEYPNSITLKDYANMMYLDILNGKIPPLNQLIANDGVIDENNTILNLYIQKAQATLNSSTNFVSQNFEAFSNTENEINALNEQITNWQNSSTFAEISENSTNEFNGANSVYLCSDFLCTDKI